MPALCWGSLLKIQREWGILKEQRRICSSSASLSHCTNCSNFAHSAPPYRDAARSYFWGQLSWSSRSWAHMLHTKEHNRGAIVQGQFSLRSYCGLHSRVEMFPLLSEEILTNVGSFTACSRTVKKNTYYWLIFISYFSTSVHKNI